MIASRVEERKAGSLKPLHTATSLSKEYVRLRKRKIGTRKTKRRGVSYSFVQYQLKYLHSEGYVFPIEGNDEEGHRVVYYTTGHRFEKPGPRAIICHPKKEDAPKTKEQASPG